MIKGVHIYFLAVAFLSVLVGCKEKQPVSVEKDMIPPTHTQIINWEHFNSSAFHNVSFPLWFNSEIVAEKQVEQLDIAVFRHQENISKRLPRDTFPDQVWQFFFDENGWVKDITLKEYVAAIHIVTHEFNYKNKPDTLGYSLPTVTTQYLFSSQQNQLTGLFNQVKDLQLFSRLILEKSDSNHVIFKNALPLINEKHIFITDSSNWNVHFIDQEFGANGKNYYYYGLPDHYVQRFKLENLVEKTLDEKRSYYPSSIIKKQKFYSDGFYRSRTFIYDSLGWCRRFKDSIFGSDKTFIHDETTSIAYNSNELPISMSTFSSNDTLAIQKKRRVFRYTISEDK